MNLPSSSSLQSAASSATSLPASLQAARPPAVSAVGRRFVGAYRADPALPLLDFGELDLQSDGSYVARVEATLVNPGVRTFGASSCMLPESGSWNVYMVLGQTRIRIRPTTGRARVYIATLEGDSGSGSITIARRGDSTTLRSDGAPPLSQ